MQNKHSVFKSQKNLFLMIFYLLSLALILMPLLTTFNDVLTRLVIKLDTYRFIQDVVVPWEVRMVGVILYPFGFQSQVAGEYLAISGGPLAGLGNNKFLIEIAWNCIGWQSLIFFIITSWIGLQGNRYTNFSKTKTWLLGFLGTFLVNLFRIATVALIAFYFGQNVAIIFHDYGSTIVVLAWLFIFWRFSYSYILEEKLVIQNK